MNYRHKELEAACSSTLSAGPPSRQGGPGEPGCFHMRLCSKPAPPLLPFFQIHLTPNMAPITTASNEETHAALLDTLDMQKLPKPFRKPLWRPPQRRNKNLKQILSEASRAQASLMNTQQNSGASTPAPFTDGEVSATPMSLDPNPSRGSQELSRLVLEKNAAAGKGLNGNGGSSLGVPLGMGFGPSVTYTSIAAAPSLRPKKKYCDITGLPARYTDPKTGLNYYNAEVYTVIRTLGTTQVHEYLAARGANTVLK